MRAREVRDALVGDGVVAHRERAYTLCRCRLRALCRCRAHRRDDEIRDRRRGVGRASTFPPSGRPPPCAADGRRSATVRSRHDYEPWYPTFAVSGLAVATWPVEYCGLDLTPAQARVVEHDARAVQPRPAQPARPEQRRAGAVRVRHRGAAAALPAADRAQRGEVVPAASASPAPAPTSRRSQRVPCATATSGSLTGQKVWTTWAHLATSPICLARTDPSVPKRQGLTYFLVDLHAAGRRRAAAAPHRRRGRLQRGVPRRGARARRAPRRCGGRRLAGRGRDAGRRAPDGVGLRFGRRRPHRRRGRRPAHRRARGLGARPTTRSSASGSWRCTARSGSATGPTSVCGPTVRAGGTPGPAASIGKVHQGALNQQHPAAGRRSARPCDATGVADAVEAWAVRHAVRGAGHAAQPGQHDRGRHDRGQQEHRRRAGARPAARARPWTHRGTTRDRGEEVLVRDLRAPDRRAARPVGWLINNRPDQLNAMNAADARRVRRRVDRARRRPRRARHRAHGRTAARSRPASTWPRSPATASGMQRYREVGRELRPPLHRLAPAGVEAGDHRGQRHLRGGGFHWVADADIVIAASDAQFFDPHVSIGQVVALEAIGLIRKMPVEAVMRMAFVGKYERMPADAGARARDDLRDRRPARAAPRAGPGARREDRPQLAGGDGGDQEGAVGRARARPHRRLQGRRRSTSCRMWGHPDQDEGPRAFAEKRDPPTGQPLCREPRGAAVRPPVRRRRARCCTPSTGAVTAGEARADARAPAPPSSCERRRASGPARSRSSSPTSPELVATMFGVWLAGGVFVPVNPRQPDAEVRRGARRSRAGGDRRRADGVRPLDGAQAVRRRTSRS